MNLILPSNLNWKTSAAALIAAFLALNGAFHWFPQTMVDVLMPIAAGLGLIGVHHAVEDAPAAVVVAPVAPVLPVAQPYPPTTQRF
jgi:hypothetical protein